MSYGMTNHSTVISIDDKRYLVRTPGEGTNELINREQEAIVYDTIADLHISDDIVYIDSKTGVKITRFVENSHTCDKNNKQEVKACIDFLKHNLHEKDIKVNFVFDFEERIKYYISLLKDKKTPYHSDFYEVYKRIMKLISFTKKMKANVALTHIDANPDNFLIDENGNIKLIDWEYAAMQDPHVDIAMFAIYSGYSKRQLDELIDMYFEKEIDCETRAKIYAYVAISGFLWHCWCEYKETKGITYGEYSDTQYKYAQIYSELLQSYFCSHEIRRPHNAIILAAGKGTRLGELTIDTPKPLIKVNGKPIIEYSIEALKNRNVNDITIVVGYKAERFSYLCEKYGVTLYFNPFYDTSNNITSLHIAEDKLGDTIIFDGDEIISESVIPSIYTASYYAYTTVEGYTTEWTLDIDKKWLITNVNTQPNLLGGNILKSYSVWCHEDAQYLKRFITKAIVNNNINTYWDNVPCEINKKDFFVHAVKVSENDIIEIDTPEDLKKAEEILNEKAK